MSVNKEELLFKKIFAGKASSDNTTPYFSEPSVTNARLSVFSGDVWTEAHLIPNSGIGDPTGSVVAGGNVEVGVVKYYSASSFTAIVGAPNEAGYSLGVRDWIPFNFGDGSTYNYVLKKSNGDLMNPGDDANNWTFDTEAGVLIFHDGNPSNVSPSSPPTISAYAYTGKKLSDGINSNSITGSLLGTASHAINSNNTSNLISSLDYSLKQLTSSDQIFFSGSINKKYKIDFAKVFSGSSNELELSSGSLTITASGIQIKGDLEASGSVVLDGALSFNGVSMNETLTFSKTGSTVFGSGSDPGDVSHTFTGSILLTGSGIIPNGTGTINLGNATNKFSNLFAVNTFFGGIHEINLETEGLNKMQEGTILSLEKGILVPCKKEADPLVMGVVSKEENYPIVLGAEPILITGKINEGDYIITSNIEGHGKGINPKYIYDKQLFGKIIAQAIEKGEGKSYTIKAMIRKM